MGCEFTKTKSKTNNSSTIFLFNQKQKTTKAKSGKNVIKFIDLFAGIGGIRIGVENACKAKKRKYKCVFSSELDKYAQRTYEANFHEKPAGDITKIDEKDIPVFDILCAGFPCQPFSIAGKQRGFEDTRGTLFFDIARIIKYHKPKVVFLENVKNLLTHDKGRTFQVIKKTLEDLGYFVNYKILNAKDFGLPQNRERIYIVAFDKEYYNYDFDYPESKNIKTKLEDILDDKVDGKYYYNKYPIYDKIKNQIERGKIYQWRRIYLRENKYNLCPTLTANMGTGGHNVPLIKDKKDIRKLTPRECFKIQGFNDNYVFPNNIADNCLYKQIGNSVSIPVVENIFTNIFNCYNLI